jgi:anaerobic nitric oxide reductase transcription regulator
VRVDATNAGVSGGVVADVAPLAGPPGTLNDQVERFERQAILDAVQRNGGNWAAAARDLGLHRSNLHHRASRLGLKER